MTTVEQDAHAYYFDLRDKVPSGGGGALAYIRRATADPRRANPVTIAQFALGALQHRDPSLDVAVTVAVDWVESWVEPDGSLPYRFAMPHTFPLAAPWTSALAQGEAASLLLRAAAVLDRPELVELARHLAAPLLATGSPLAVETSEGPVLQEYPTSPPAHVLNGWITALWGLHDVGTGYGGHEGEPEAEAAFVAGTDALEKRLHLYRTYRRWSRYDLFPHPLPNVASPSYHLLHVGHLRALHDLAPRAVFASTADEWEQSGRDARSRAVAVARKGAFRILRPRGRMVEVAA